MAQTTAMSALSPETCMKRVIRVFAALVVLVVTFYASLFAFAEAFTEIVVLRTYDAGGLAYQTRVTVVDIAGTPWVRGRPYRRWFRRIEANPSAELYRGDVWLPVMASVSRDPADSAEFERAMLEGYGLVYRCLDFFARMSSNEIPVRLSPRGHGGRRSSEPVDRSISILARFLFGTDNHRLRPLLL
jgi:hypothetical protein